MNTEHLLIALLFAQMVGLFILVWGNRTSVFKLSTDVLNAVIDMKGEELKALSGVSFQDEQANKFTELSEQFTREAEEFLRENPTAGPLIDSITHETAQNVAHAGETLVSGIS